MDRMNTAGGAAQHLVMAGKVKGSGCIRLDPTSPLSRARHDLVRMGLAGLDQPRDVAVRHRIAVSGDEWTANYMS
jgi:hypothetical protein